MKLPMNQFTCVEWRGPVAETEIVELVTSVGGHAEAGWWDRVRPHSLGWGTARGTDEALVGFVNVARDGDGHAFLLDTMTHGAHQRQGIATRFVEIAAQEARNAGCEWLHLDFAKDLAAFYFASCGFRSTAAGLIHLPRRPDG